MQCNFAKIRYIIHFCKSFYWHIKTAHSKETLTLMCSLVLKLLPPFWEPKSKKVEKKKKRKNGYTIKMKLIASKWIKKVDDIASLVSLAQLAEHCIIYIGN
jgi:hypothetical protein